VRNFRLALAASLLAVAAFACKKTRCMDPANDSDVETRKEDVAALAKLVEKDPQFCRELAAPRVALEGDKLMLHGTARHLVGRRSDLPLDDIRSVDPLKQRVQAYRVLWKTLHPGREFPSAPEVSLDANLEIARALSVTHTLAVAGFRHQRVVAVDVDVTVDWWVPHPADGPYPTKRILDVKLIEDGVCMVRLRKQGCVSTQWERVFPRPDNFAKIITRLCNGDEHCPRYIEVRAPKTYRFRQALIVIHDIVEARALYKHDPDDEEIALLLSGSSPNIFSPGLGAPEIDGAAYCLPDGGTSETLVPDWMPAAR
jgi:hypothetical protein